MSVLLSIQPGYTATQLRQLSEGMKGAPVSWAIAGLVVAGVVFFALLVVAARQNSIEEEAREAERAQRRARDDRARGAESRVWRKTTEVVTTTKQRRST